VILSFLKFERERFPLFVPDFSALQPFAIPDRLHERSMIVFRRFSTFLRTEKLRNIHETSRNGQDVGRPETIRVHASKTKESLYKITYLF
jgi:hypothetical protein